MKAWRIHDKEQLTLDELPIQSVGEGCAKIKTLVSGISLTDILMYRGQLVLRGAPMIIGRQCVGMVTEVGQDVTGLQRGDRVVIDPFVNCKNCTACNAGRSDECEKLICNGVDDNGFMSDFIVASSNALYKLPERIKDSDAVFTEHIALSINTVNKLNLEKGEHIVIVGANALGIILAQVAIYNQAVPILIDTDAENLAIAEELGIYYTINSVDSDPMKRIFTITGGKMAETVAFINMAQMAFGRSLDYAARGGRVAMVGWADVADEITGRFEAILNKQLKVIGVNNGVRMFPAAINLLATRTVDVSRLVRCEVPFSEVGEAVRAGAENDGRYMKTLVRF